LECTELTLHNPLELLFAQHKVDRDGIERIGERGYFEIGGSMSLSGHQSAKSKSDEWLTPPEILNVLGEFDLDPCAPVVRPWDTAKHYFTKQDNGLSKPWDSFGRIWCNPPFGREAVKWLRRMAAHGNGIALIPARTETTMFYETVWGVADGVLFLKGRPHFHYVDGRRAAFNSGAPIALIAYGKNNLNVLSNSDLGAVVVMR
jgi:hypothetical protein